MLSLELGPEVANLKCDCCGEHIQSVNGYIKKDDWANAIYFASLQRHPAVEAGLTISIGKWWADDAAAIRERRWIYMRVWPSEEGSGFEIRIEEPEESRHIKVKILGKKTTRAKARLLPNLEEYFDVAHFVIDNDPAVLSYLEGKPINIVGRVCNHA